MALVVLIAAAAGRFFNENFKAAHFNLNNNSYPATRDITYCRPGGVAQKLDLYPPANLAAQPKFPLVVYMHGGSWESGDKAAPEVLKYISLLSSHNYVIASVNYRLLPQYKFPAQVQDVKCAIRFLRANAAKYRIDNSKVAVIGESAGGYLAAFSAVTAENPQFKTAEYAQNSDKAQAAIDLFGPSDFTVGNALSSQAVAARQFISGTDPATASVTHYVDAADPPFLIVHGEIDNVVPLDQSQRLYQKLRASNVPAQLIIVRNAGHGLSATDGKTILPSYDEITSNVISFLNLNLK
jgi:acetyl esterase/lipase